MLKNNGTESKETILKLFPPGGFASEAEQAVLDSTPAQNPTGNTFMQLPNFRIDVDRMDGQNEKPYPRRWQLY